ncbi:hypothetical protein RvY_08961, partial [Ramazzottius varieornatus]
LIDRASWSAQFAEVALSNVEQDHSLTEACLPAAQHRSNVWNLFEDFMLGDLLIQQ